MVKNISKIWKVVLLIMGVGLVMSIVSNAEATQIYNNNGNTLDLSIKFQDSIVSDQHGNENKKSAPIEMCTGE